MRFRRRQPLRESTKSNRGMEMKERHLVSSSLDSSWHTVPANRVVGTGGSERPFKPLDRARERSAHHLGCAQVSQVLVLSRLQSWRIQNKKMDEPGNTRHTARPGDVLISHLTQSLRLQFLLPHGHPAAAHPLTGNGAPMYAVTMRPSLPTTKNRCSRPAAIKGTYRTILPL
jgi:hypothetical protein